MGDDMGATVTATLAMIPFMLFWILYPNWGSTLYGEVRGSGDFRKVLRGMLGGIWVTAGLAIVVHRPRGQHVRLAVLQRDERQLHQLLLRIHDRPDRAHLELPAAHHVLSRGQHDLPDRDGGALRGVVPGLVRDAVPVVHADDLRGGVRPGPARERGTGLRATGRADHRPALHHDPVDHRERALRLLARTSGR